MYLCMYVCVYVRMYICMCVRARVCVHVYVCVYTDTHIHTHTYIHTYIHACVHANIHTHKHACVHIVSDRTWRRGSEARNYFWLTCRLVDKVSRSSPYCPTRRSTLGLFFNEGLPTLKLVLRKGLMKRELKGRKSRESFSFFFCVFRQDVMSIMVQKSLKMVHLGVLIALG